MRVVIADDEPLARSRLARLCGQCGDLDVAAEAASGREAIVAIQTHRPDLVLLDVELQDMTGFDVLAALDGTTPTTIMVTAHSEHALQAFEFEALDFLTKPVNEDRFEAAIDRARHRQPQTLAADWRQEMAAALRAALDAQTRTPGSRTRILAEKSRRLYFIEPELIESACEARRGGLGPVSLVPRGADVVVRELDLRSLALHQREPAVAERLAGVLALHHPQAEAVLHLDADAPVGRSARPLGCERERGRRDVPLDLGVREHLVEERSVRGAERPQA